MMGTCNCLARSTPSAEGLDPRAVLRFLDEAAEKKIELHSLMIIRNGKVACEGWWDPYRPDTRQACYSVTKTFAMTAIGLAVGEGLLSVDDRVSEFFPDKLPENPSGNLLSMTIHDLMCMGGGQETEVDVHGSDDWVKIFLAEDSLHKPGTVFKYNSIGSHMLAEIIYRVTGQTLLEYLTPRVFDVIGIRGVKWDTTPAGLEIGGWGIHITTEDLARMGLLYLQDGVWNGRRVLPEGWVKTASGKKIDNAGTSVDYDWTIGYCYQMWISSPARSYRLDGAYGQFSIVLPEQNAVIALTECVGSAQPTLDLVWKNLVAGMSQEPCSDPDGDRAVRARLLSGAIDDGIAARRSSLERTVAGKTFAFGENREHLMTEFERFALTRPQAGISAVRLNFTGNVCAFTFTCGGMESTIRVGLDGRRRRSAVWLGDRRQCVEAVGGWADDATFRFAMRPVEEPQTNFVTLHFDGDCVGLFWKDSIDLGMKPHVLSGRCA